MSYKEEKETKKRRTRNTKKIWEEDPAAGECFRHFSVHHILTASEKKMSMRKSCSDATYQDENAIFAYTSFALYKVQLEYKKSQTPQFPKIKQEFLDDKIESFIL